MIKTVCDKCGCDLVSGNSGQLILNGDHFRSIYDICKGCATIISDQLDKILQTGPRTIELGKIGPGRIVSEGKKR